MDMLLLTLRAKTGLSIFFLGYMFLVIFLYGCAPKSKPSDSPTIVCDERNIWIDPMYQVKGLGLPYHDDTSYNAFQEGFHSKYDENGPLYLAASLFKVECVDVSYCDETPIPWHKDSTESSDYVILWQVAHFDSGHGMTCPYFIFSMKAHKYDGINVLNPDRLLGLEARAGGCARIGDPPLFDEINPIFSMLMYDNLKAEEIRIHDYGASLGMHGYTLTNYSHRNWGITIAHELGHTVACLSDNQESHDWDTDCVLKDYTLGDVLFDHLLEDPCFCDCCLHYIRISSCDTCEFDTCQ